MTKDKNSTKESFQKGNINFNLLQPGDDKKNESPAVADIEKGKRGIFFQKANLKPLKTIHIWAWCMLLTASFLSMVFVFFQGKSFIWLLILPIVILVFLWSSMMLILIIARPR